MLIGASRVEQIEENIAAQDNTDFTSEELSEIDLYATESRINNWAKSSEAG